MIVRFYRRAYDQLGPFWWTVSVLAGSAFGGWLFVQIVETLLEV